MYTNRKIIFDGGVITHKAIYAYSMMKEKGIDCPPATYTAMSMMLGTLARIGLRENDEVIICLDSRGNWRKSLRQEYKGQRAEQREKTDVNWKEEYEKMNTLFEQIDNTTDWFVISSPKTEADDLIAESVRFFKDYECIVVSIDKDFHQLFYYDNFKMFNIHSAHKLIPYIILDLDRDKEKQKAYGSLFSKIKKEKTDNLVAEIITEKEDEVQDQVVNLLKLPEFVSQPIQVELEKISKTIKQVDPENFPFARTLYPRYLKCFDENNPKIITYEQCRVKFAKKLEKKKKIKKLDTIKQKMV